MKHTRADWGSFTQFVHELIAGPRRRNVLTRWELDLLFDLQTVQLRKSARAQMLRRYVKAVTQSWTEGAETPPRLLSFLEANGYAVTAGAQPRDHVRGANAA